ncbi:MAG TPA: DUF4340 domain-containing protein [Opitutaceae bacterium]|nr:DUF4340 domain-containing protein [Opitutaceae bacterium]
MRTKVTLVLIFLNVAVFFSVFYLKVSVPTAQHEGSLLGPEVVNIQSLEISAANRPAPVRIERRGDGWVLTQPLDWPANEFAVNRIVNELQQLRSEASFPVKELAKSGQSLADYGLDKPPLTVSLTPAPVPTNPTPQPIVLRIGDTAKVGNRLYILSPDGERVHVVQRSLAESLLVKLEDLRSDTLFSIPVFEVRSLNLQTGAPAGSKVRIARSNSRWIFETPFSARANKNETDVAVSRLNGLRIQSFIDPRSPEPLRLTPDDMTLRITLEGNNRRETLIVGGRVRDSIAVNAPGATPAATPTPTALPSAADAANAATANAATSADGDLYFAKMEDKAPVFTVAIPTSLLDALRNAQETLRDRRILDIDPASITSLTLSGAGQAELTLQRLESTSTNPLSSAWQMIRHADDRSPQSVPADREIIDHLIQHLCELTAQKFESDAPIETALEKYGFNRPARTFKFSLATGQSAASGATTTATPLMLLLGIGEDHKVYAKLDSPNYVYLVPDEILAQTPIDPLAYRERLLRDLPAGAKIAGLKLVDLSNQDVLLDVTLPLPADTAANAQSPERRAAIETLATQLRTLRAKRFVRERFTKTILVNGEERPWHYQLVSTIALVGGNGTQNATSVLFLSDRTGGNTQFIGAPDPGFDVVFEAEQPLLDALFTLIYGSRDPGPSAPPQRPALPN